MRAPGEKWPKKVHLWRQKSHAPKPSKKRTETINRRWNRGNTNRNQQTDSTLSYTDKQRRFAIACGRFNKFS
jgi:hypothetical protein